MEHNVKNFLLPPILKFPRHEGVGPSEKASLGGQTGGSANKKKKSILKIQLQFDNVFPLVMDINSCLKIVWKSLV